MSSAETEATALDNRSAGRETIATEQRRRSYTSRRAVVQDTAAISVTRLELETSYIRTCRRTDQARLDLVCKLPCFSWFASRNATRSYWALQCRSVTHKIFAHWTPSPAPPTHVISTTATSSPTTPTQHPSSDMSKLSASTTWCKYYAYPYHPHSLLVQLPLPLWPPSM